jgi:hypothetical protein
MMDELRTWLEARGLFISSIDVDDQNLPIDSQVQWRKLSLDGVSKVALSADRIEDLRIANLETVLSFLDLFDRALETQAESLFSQVHEGFPYLRESLANHFDPAPERQPGRSIGELEQLLGKGLSSQVPGEKSFEKQCKGHIEELRAVVANRLEESRNPLPSLMRLTAALKRSISEISEVSLLLQTGKDESAMDAIVRFSELAGEVMGHLSRLPYQISLRDLKIGEDRAEDSIKALNEVLKELVSAFDAKDSVLLGDLLEYEVAPRLDLLTSFIEEMQEIIVDE